jgi:hypothetical protein
VIALEVGGHWPVARHYSRLAARDTFDAPITRSFGE